MGLLFLTTELTHPTGGKKLLLQFLIYFFFYSARVFFIALDWSNQFECGVKKNLSKCL